MLLEPIFLINLFSSVFLCGLIWVIQLVHYPSFHYVNEDRFLEFHQFHNTRISVIVLPLMISELITSGLLWWPTNWISLHSIGFYLVIGIWLSTFLISVPLHGKLGDGKNDSLIIALVNTNWIRTFFWTAKALLSVLILINN